MPNRHLVLDMTKYLRELTVPSDDLSVVHEFLKGVWQENPHLTPRDRNSIETAIIELVSNIILYATATAGITCQIVIEIDQERIHARITDNGELADLEIDEHIMPDEFSERGRGIPLIRALVDEFSYENVNKENTWKISKRIQA